METQVQQEEYMNSTQEYVNNMDSTSAQAIEKVESKIKSTANEADYQLQVAGNKASNFFATLPEYISAFYQQYKLPIIAIGALVLGIVVLRVFFAVLGAFNDIPLVAPLFELIGIGYTAWFTNRYLLKVETRKELAGEIRSLKAEILGSR
ncbi:MAG: CAAD domain-containing protein [Calothrix sp. FI2-JRJ7]|jgi:hypothetical protein|nr:CAAD domain-containing protein [Calothrix sp. FI2-JRJ7]